MTKEKNFAGKKFEFLLLINGNIICQRYFGVKSFNPSVLNSYELKTCADKCISYITGESEEWQLAPETTLRGKTWEYLWSGYNPYMEEYPLPESKNNYENEDIFTFQIKIDNKTIIERIFSGNDYPPKVRYDVDIRGAIHKIINEIQETLAEKKLTLVS
jgi:hypothetical protein